MQPDSATPIIAPTPSGPEPSTTEPTPTGPSTPATHADSADAPRATTLPAAPAADPATDTPPRLTRPRPALRIRFTSLPIPTAPDHAPAAREDRR